MIGFEYRARLYSGFLSKSYVIISFKNRASSQHLLCFRRRAASWQPNVVKQPPPQLRHNGRVLRPSRHVNVLACPVNVSVITGMRVQLHSERWSVGAHNARDVVLQTNVSFDFSYVCPEPVLANIRLCVYTEKTFPVRTEWNSHHSE